MAPHLTGQRADRFPAFDMAQVKLKITVLSLAYMRGFGRIAVRGPDTGWQGGNQGVRAEISR